MRYNPQAFFAPVVSHADLASRIAVIRQAEREQKTEYPMTIEAIIRQWEKSK